MNLILISFFNYTKYNYKIYNLDGKPRSKYSDHKLIDLLAIAKSRNEANKKGTTVNLYENQKVHSTMSKITSKFDELGNDVIDDKSFEEPLNQRMRLNSTYQTLYHDENSNKLIEELKQLDQELDMSEQLIEHKADPTMLNDTKISESLAMLLEQAPDLKNEQLHQVNENLEANRYVYADAQLQDLKNSHEYFQSKSNFTGSFLNILFSIYIT